MKENVRLVEFGEVVAHAASIGYDWNKANDFLAKDILPWPGEHTMEHYLSDLRQYRHSEDTIKVLESFFNIMESKTSPLRTEQETIDVLRYGFCRRCGRVATPLHPCRIIGSDFSSGSSAKSSKRS